MPARSTPAPPARHPLDADRRRLPTCGRCRRRRVAYPTAIYCRPCADEQGCSATGGSMQWGGGEEDDE